MCKKNDDDKNGRLVLIAINNTASYFAKDY